MLTENIFQSTRPMRGATLFPSSCRKRGNISIHAPHAGRDQEAVADKYTAMEFQSTRPMRGATFLAKTKPISEEDFNPRAPCGARQMVCLFLLVDLLFQSTRPMRGATTVGAAAPTCFLFQSTRPMRGATPQTWYAYNDDGISIHAPHAGRDDGYPRCAGAHYHFNPRAPCGARLPSPRPPSSGRGFQSTRPMRGATAKVNKLLCTFLQKRHGFQIFLRKTLPFKAFCRLQIGKNFSICGANRCGNFCELLLRTIRSSVLPEGRSACSQNAQFYSHTFSRDNRNADCLFPDP